ncbi:hypothetical protein [Microlunatus antarcticus]|uniref:Uncharacterized protein n=1 Tax=Microlunatus antarcticus TaxID=53388 RepID=A0A7W5JW81_9ACTN|nr:hypothetical protein [Microlunatus antarcticus]MBB3327466.1 hypothetical protein [Microlunatus antarcticus]
MVDTLTLRFEGEDEDGTKLHELRASHVAEVLQGLVGLTGDFVKAGAFGDGPAGSEVLVRPAQEGSFLIEVVRFVHDNQDGIKTSLEYAGVPTVSQIIYWSSKSARATVKAVDHSLDNGKVGLSWSDDTYEEVPEAVWEELNKRKRRRKKQLRQIMAPLSDSRVTQVQVQSPPPVAAIEADAETETDEGEDADDFTLTRPDYDAARPEDEVEETENVFETEAQMSAIDFDRPDNWRVKTAEVKRNATVEDADFLALVAGGLAIRKTDIFNLRVRENATEKNGRTTRTWTVLEVLEHRRAAHDNDA